MKSLLETQKHDLKREINKVNEKIEALFKWADDADAKTRALEERCCLLESKLATSPLAKDLSIYVEEVIKEAEERYKRRKHFIISGVAEHESWTVEGRRNKDTEIVERIAGELGIANLKRKKSPASEVYVHRDPGRFVANAKVLK